MSTYVEDAVLFGRRLKMESLPWVRSCEGDSGGRQEGFL